MPLPELIPVEDLFPSPVRASATMVKDDEGHGFLNPDNQIGMYRAVERFLGEYLVGRRC